MKWIKKCWHFIFIFLCLCVSASIVTRSFIHKAEETAIKREVSQGSIPKDEYKKNGILILCYHRILKEDYTMDKIATKITNNAQFHEYAVFDQEFKKQILYLKKHNVKIISMDEAINLIKSGEPLQHQYVVLTFDDFDQSVYYNARPIIEKYKLPYTLFIVTNNMERYDNGTQLTSWAQIRNLYDDGLSTIGVHTNNMHYLINNKPALLKKGNYKAFTKDYQRAMKKIEYHLNVIPKYYAYPYGAFTPKEQRYLVKHGMVTFSLETQIIQAGYPLNQPLPRTMVDVNSWKNIRKWVR